MPVLQASTDQTYVACLCLCVCLQNDFTPEQEEEVRRENQWAFD